MKKSKPPGIDQAPMNPGGSDDYEVQGHLDTLHRAADIMADPDKLTKVHKLAGRRHKALKGMLANSKPIKTIADLRERANKKVSDPNEPDEDDL